MTTVECDEWFTVEGRYYKGDRDTVRLKWYVNGEVVAVTDNFYVKDSLPQADASPANPTAGAKLLIYAMKSPAFVIYIDNVSMYFVSESYTKESGELVYNVDAQ